jgi:predicted peptidase
MQGILFGGVCKMKKRDLAILILLLAGPVFAPSIAQTEPKPGIQAACKFSVTIDLDYLLYLPRAYDQNGSKKWPLILFLHGAGERGENVEFVKIWGPANMVEEKDLPFIVLSPQCPGDKTWASLLLPVKKLLDEITIKYRVDLSRIYLTGLSMGGYGTFAMVENYPGYFAAYAPICGGGNPMSVARYAHVPAWIFHGDQDNAVPFINSQVMADSLKAHGAEVKFTIYKGMDHYSWIPAYAESGLFDWFLTKQKNYRHFPY